LLEKELKRPERREVTEVTLRLDGMVDRLAESVEGPAVGKDPKQKGPRLATRPRYQAACRVVSGCRSEVSFRMVVAVASSCRSR
jgi:hypothetical protein